jgi:hypothetical protein
MFPNASRLVSPFPLGERQGEGAVQDMAPSVERSEQKGIVCLLRDGHSGCRGKSVTDSGDQHSQIHTLEKFSGVT